MPLLENMLKLTSGLLVLNKKCCSLPTPPKNLTEFIQTLFHILLILKWMYSLDYMAYVLRFFYLFFFKLTLRRAESYNLRQLSTL